jgi:hypothetical protein
MKGGNCWIRAKGGSAWIPAGAQADDGDAGGLQFIDERSATGKAENGGLPTIPIESRHQLDKGPFRPARIEVGDAERDADRRRWFCHNEAVTSNQW